MQLVVNAYPMMDAFTVRAVVLEESSLLGERPKLVLEGSVRPRCYHPACLIAAVEECLWVSMYRRNTEPIMGSGYCGSDIL